MKDKKLRKWLDSTGVMSLNVKVVLSELDVMQAKLDAVLAHLELVWETGPRLAATIPEPDQDVGQHRNERKDRGGG